MKVLDVPYVKQTGATADKFRNDCGIACCLMLMKFLKKNSKATVDSISAKSHLALNKDKGLTPADLIQMLRTEKIASKAVHDLTPEQMREEIDNGRPVILLVNYAHFGGKFFGHYVVLIGYNENGFVVHDPYLRGPNFELSLSKMREAVTDVSAFYFFKAQGVLISE